MTASRLPLRRHPDPISPRLHVPRIARTISELPFDLNLWQAQNLWYDTFRNLRENPPSPEWLEKLKDLGRLMHIAVEDIVSEETNGNHDAATTRPEVGLPGHIVT